MNKITVAIPTHAMENREYFLRRCLDSLWEQSFQDFDIVVSDNSDDSIVKGICDYYGGIKYGWNPRKGMAQNTNDAIKRSTGELIKILYMDDFLAHKDSLQEIWDNFSGYWLVTGCENSSDGVNRFNTHYPYYNSDSLQRGVNTIGSPSVLTIRNKNPLMFDESMTWVLDCDYYRRYYESHGSPVILKTLNVVVGVGQHQITNKLSDHYKTEETNLLINKYA